jgi:hypothetical protein
VFILLNSKSELLDKEQKWLEELEPELLTSAT